MQAILTRPIGWALIEHQYDQMIRYATALRLGTAAAADILRRFTRANLQHPTYRALIKLGKALRMVLVCRCLNSLELRREIQEGSTSPHSRDMATIPRTLPHMLAEAACCPA